MRGQCACVQEVCLDLYNAISAVFELNFYGGWGVSMADCMQTDKVNSSLEKRNFCFFSFSSFTNDFENLIEPHSSFLHSNCFLKVLENWLSVVKICQVDNVMYQNIQCIGIF